MPLFLPYFLSPLFYHFFFSFSILLLSFSSYPFCGFFLLLKATSPLLILLDSMGFLPFIPKASPTIFGFLWTSLQDYLLTRWLPNHYLYLECACCTTPHSKTKLLVLFLPFPLSVLPEWIRIGGSHSLPTPMTCIKLSQPFACLFWARCHPSKAFFPKRRLGKNLKIDPFSPYHQTTPFKSLNRGPTFLYWLSVG